MTAGSAPAFSATFGSNNRMVGYSYDNNGNQLTTPDGATLEYDPDNRMTKWTKQGQVDQYQYHPSGWRLSKGSEKYLYGPGGQLLESYRAWNDITDYVYFGGRLLYTLSGDTAVTRIYSDRLGSTRATETIQQYGGGWTTRNYYPYGEEITSTSNDQYKFASTYRDSTTGLDYAVNRYYASGTGRFLNPDPKSGSAKAERPQTWNLYAYAGNNPVNSIDPRGLNQDECQIPTTGDLIPDCLAGGGGSNGPCFIDPFYPVPDPYCGSVSIPIVTPIVAPAPQKPKPTPGRPAYISYRTEDDCYTPSAFTPGAWVRNRLYRLYDTNGDEMSKGTIQEHLTAVAGTKPPESHGGNDGVFLDTISVEGTGNFAVTQTFTVTVPGTAFGSVSVFVRDPTGGDFGTLGIAATPDRVYINGNDAYDAGKMRKCKW